MRRHANFLLTKFACDENLTLMTLHDWLRSQGKTQTWLAGKVSVSVATISRLARGEAASLDLCLAEALLRLTDGAVTPNDLHAQRRAWLAARGLLQSPASSVTAIIPPPAYLMEAAE